MRIGTIFPIPRYATDQSSGIDLYACCDTDIPLKPGDTELISSGIAIHIGDQNHTALIFPRSGLGTKEGIVLSHLTGVIDADYQGPLMIPLWNRGEKTFILQPGMRVAQMLFIPLTRAHFKEVKEFSSTSGRGSGGFGHTGQ